MTSSDEAPAWKRRAVQRMIGPAKLRAEQRVQRFLDAAAAVVEEKGTIDFTLDEVMERSARTLRSFYLQFEGKHELLLALLEDALVDAVDRVNDAIVEIDDPMLRLRVAIEILFDLCRPDPVDARPLFTEFTPQLLTSNPAQLRQVYAPLLALFAELFEQIEEEGGLRADARPRVAAAMVMHTVLFTAQSIGVIAGDPRPVTATEVSMFCVYGMVR